MLTPRMAKLLSFIETRLRETGICPSFDDMADALDLRSKSGIYRMLRALEERGFIRRIPNRARAIEVIRRRELRMVVDPPRRSAPTDLVSIPHYGSLRMGSVPERLAAPQRTMLVPSATLPSADCFAFDAGDSAMARAGIVAGDTIIIERVKHAATGDIVLAVLDEDELVLRRFRFRGGLIALEPANEAFVQRICARERVRIVGRVCGLIRLYRDVAVEASAG